MSFLLGYFILAVLFLLSQFLLSLLSFWFFTHVDVPNSGSRVSLCFCKFLPHTGDDQQQLLNANRELSAESLSLMCLMKGISLFNCPHCMDKGIIFGRGELSCLNIFRKWNSAFLLCRLEEHHELVHVYACALQTSDLSNWTSLL